MANEHFISHGHSVSSIHLQHHIADLQQASEVLYTKDPNPQERMSASPYIYNYGRAKTEGYLSNFAEREIEKLRQVDLLFIQMPILVWTIPAILKSYMENTFIAKALFDIDKPWSKEFNINGYMNGKKVFISMVTGSGPEMTASVVGSVDNLITPIRSMFEFVGYEWLEPHVTWGTTRTWGPCDEYLTNFKSYLQTQGDFNG
jgi:putative NADPH-quinone reductase